MIKHENYPTWVRWFSGKTFIEALQELEKESLEKRLRIIDKVKELLTPNPQYHGEVVEQAAVTWTNKTTTQS